MTKQDYIKIAALLKDEKPIAGKSVKSVAHDIAYEAWVRIVTGLAAIFAADNSRFDHDRFVTACGVELA